MISITNPEIRKAFIWALISLPITGIGFIASFALAHGSLGLLIPFLIPGYATFWLTSDYEIPSWLIVAIVFLVQYVAYFLLIWGILQVKRIIRARD